MFAEKKELSLKFHLLRMIGCEVLDAFLNGYQGLRGLGVGLELPFSEIECGGVADLLSESHCCLVLHFSYFEKRCLCRLT